MTKLSIAVAALLSAFSALAMAAADNPAAPPPPPPLQLHRAEGPIAVDGDLNDPGWQNAAKIDTFYETSPGNSTPPKVQTTAYITYDDKYFYIGIHCADPDPSKIRAPYVDRDQVIGTDDNIAVFLDTRNDKRTAMELRVNPRGIQGDGLFNDANFNEDFSPDFFYDTAARITSTGWDAEYRIPFSSLRYNDAPSQTWNILIWRNYPRDYRYAYQSAPVPRGANCYMCFMHPLVGLTNLPKAGNLVAAPYVTAQQSESAGPPNGALERDPFKKDAGLDVKWTPTATNAVDLTLNPDFSQVEADTAQITVNQRFAVFFPEKRPFFLEGFDLFDTPLQVAYTRTITDPRWGVRTTGKMGATGYTFLVTGDDGGGATIIPGPTGSSFAFTDFKSIDAIGRVRHSMGASAVGAVLTDREIRGGGYNRVLGPDFQWRPNGADSVTGEYLFEQNQNPKCCGFFNDEKSTSHAAYLGWTHQTQTHDWFVEGKDIGDKFRADLGFVPQVGYREFDAGGGLSFYPEKRLLNFIRVSMFADRQTDTDGNVIYRRLSPGVNMQGRKNLQAGVSVRYAEQVRVGNELPDETFFTWFFQIDPSRRFTRIGANGTVGEQIDFSTGRVGHGQNVQFFATIRPFDKITLEPLITREWLNVGGVRQYTATVERLKTTYSFSAKSLVRVIGQYVTNHSGVHTGNFLGSVLYSYKLNWQTVLFVGYGDDRDVDFRTNQLQRTDRSLFLKVSYAIQR